MVISITAILSNQLNKTKPTLWLSLEKEPSMTARQIITRIYPITKT